MESVRQSGIASRQVRHVSGWRARLASDPWRGWIGIGILWLMIGMTMMPAGASFNPSKIYQGSLLVLMYVPAIVLACKHRGRLWRELWSLPLFRIFLAMLAWATLSLTWAELHHKGDELGRLLSVMTFVIAWQLWDSDDERYVSTLLFLGGLGVAACAGYYCLEFVIHPDPQSDRIAGEGIIAATNYAAALMGAVALWMVMLPGLRRWEAVARWLSVALLLAFVVMTHTRGAWLALCACVALAPWWSKVRLRYWAVALLAMLLALAIALPMHLLTERGTSLRPQLMMQSLQQIIQHPLLGLGQGAPINLWVDGQVYTHSHNLLSQVTLQLGLPGLAITVVMWLMVGWQGWRHRHSLRGRLLLGLWIYASVMLQFDMPQLLDSPRPGWILIWLPFSLAIALGLRERRAAHADIIPG